MDEHTANDGGHLLSKAMFYPLIFKPIFQERIWGGRRLEQLFGKALPAEVPIGESWEISDRSEAQSIVANGELAGSSLGSLMQQYPREILGKASDLNGRFPLLVKILDAREKLSLQVHPPAAKARDLGGEPKTEMWYIVEAEPGADLYVGLRKGSTRAEFEERIQSGTVAECFHRVPVRAGDAMFLPSGRVHAIGAGLVIFEIQENSDTTYRVFDWNRVDKEGKPRQLNVRESLECIDFHDFEPAPVRSDSPRARLVDDPLFSVEVANLSGNEQLELPLEACCVVACVAGKIDIRGSDGLGVVELRPGSFSLVPAAMGKATIGARNGSARLLMATPK